MKVSVSLPDEDIDFLDEYGRTVGATSRSAVLQKAVRLLRATALGPAYEQAWAEWEAEGSSEVWESVAGDGFDVGEKG
ncbi:MAG: ribbon-helix-helix domain-containing protein [Thermoanaerobaculia bacterium]|nr:ribbon-helix-helix domain-containing protein [Thermoanaerobaculia bacterium]